ncbi:carbonic anyhydrase, partial [Campylobacter coli]|nr:carbonic anyhydrase [Campylobacter coli]
NLNHINVFDINSYENLNNAFIRIDQEIQKLKLNQKLNQ